MAGPVVQRPERDPPLGVALLAVVAQGPKPRLAAPFVDPGPWQQPPHRLDPVRHADARRDPHRKAQALQHLHPAQARPQLPRHRVVRQDQRRVEIGPLTQGPGVPVQRHAGILDVVDQPDLAAHELRQPDRR